MGRQRSPQHATGDHIVRYLRAANVKDGVLELDDVNSMNFTPTEQQKFALVPGDVLVTEGCGSIGQLGASAAWRGELDDVVCFQNTLLRLRAKPGITLPGFVELWARHAYASGIWADVASGTNIFHIGSRRAEVIPVQVPPLDEQARIVHLAEGLEAAELAAASNLSTLVEGWRATLSTALSAAGGEEVAVDSLLGHVIGGAWGEVPGASDVDVLALGPTAFYADPVHIDTSSATPRSLNLQRMESRVVKQHDIIIERSGGTETQPVGRVIYSAADTENVVPSDFMRLLRVDPAQAEPRFVFWVLWERYHAGGTLSFQSKTTNIRNLRVPDYLAAPMALPDRGAQEAVVELAESFFATRKALQRHHDALRTLRVATAAELLTGRHEVPTSYDTLMAAS